MSGPIEVVDAALYTLLAGDASLTALLGGESAVYNRVAPLGSPLPRVVFQWQGGGDEHLTPTRARNVVYTVKAIAGTLAEAAAVDARLDALLHHGELSAAGWATFWLAREADVAYAEVDAAGGVVWHTGGQYRIRISEEG
jgi:hypothetical protein